MTIYLGDCVKGIRRHLGDSSVDLVCTSPPYDCVKSYRGAYQFDLYGLIEQLYRVVKDGGVVAWNTADERTDGDYSATSHRQVLAFKEAGFRLNQTLIYQSTIRYWHRDMYGAVFQYVFIFCKGPRPITFTPILDRKNTNVGKRQRGVDRSLPDGSVQKVRSTYIVQENGKRVNVWPYCPTLMGPDMRESHWQNHPAAYPLKLPYDLIYSWSKRGDLVLDPFGGSGQTCLAATLQGRDFVAYEINWPYYINIQRRLQWYSLPSSQEKVGRWLGRHIPYHKAV